MPVRPPGFALRSRPDSGHVCKSWSYSHLIEQIEEVRATGTNYIVLMINFATLEQKTILASMEIMAKEVLPKFTGM